MSRYIDADELIEDLYTENFNLYMDGLKGTPRPRELSLKQVIDRINEIPTADVRENIHGEWVHDGKPIHCNVCGFNPNFSLNKDNSNYCPKCGADMRGEKE